MKCDASAQLAPASQPDAKETGTNTDLLKWRRRNSYYYEWIDSIHKSVVRLNSKVLHVGCDCGDLLAAVRPSAGVGIDTNPNAIALAQRRFPNLIFHRQDPHHLDLSGTYDYVLISNSLGNWHDIQVIFENIHKVMHDDTRVVITYFNYLWAGILRIGSRFRLRRRVPHQNWLSTEDIANLLYLTGYEVIRTASYVMVPKHVPLLAPLANRFLSLLPGFPCLDLITLLVARPLPAVRREDQVSVSVVVPCRNERGNIEGAIRRIPRMGREMEIIFVDGNSSDGTCEEIKRQIQRWPDRRIHLIHQDGGIGKGDAVRKGFAVATGDVLVIQDADLTAPPEDLIKFFRAWCQGKGELIIGSRLVYPYEQQAMRYLNLLGNKFFSMLFTWLLGQRLRDTLCGTKMISRRHYDLIVANRGFFGDLDPFGDFDLILGAVKQNLKVAEVPVRYRARTYGQTNISRFRHGWLLMKMSWLAFKRIKWLKLRQEV
ncbi:MAG: glycosyltransferase [Planctomycetes bacterium]|nr:glycosyltransferase [Planctomycetota bacterium]